MISIIQSLHLTIYSLFFHEQEVQCLRITPRLGGRDLPLQVFRYALEHLTLQPVKQFGEFFFRGGGKGKDPCSLRGLHQQFRDEISLSALRQEGEKFLRFDLSLFGEDRLELQKEDFAHRPGQAGAQTFLFKLPEILRIKDHKGDKVALCR